MLAVLYASFTADRTAWLHGELDQENDLDFKFFFLPAYFCLLNYVIIP